MMQTLSAQQTTTVASRTDIEERPGGVVVARWRLLDVLKSHTLIGVFNDAEAAAIAIKAIEADGAATRIWKALGRVMGNDLRQEWRQRSFLRRVLGSSDESRVVEDLARRLEAGDCLIAIRPRNGVADDDILPGASHLIRIGRWSFGFPR